jgi:hypothetical protein
MSAFLGVNDYSNYFRSFTLNSEVYGNFKIKRPLPLQEDPIWGCLSPLKNLPLAKNIPVVPGEVLSFALHGHIKPLLDVLGREPKYNLKINQQHVCFNKGTCLSFDKKKCFPSLAMPICYEYPQGHDPLLVDLINEVFVSWKHGYYLIVVDGDEFIL